MPPGEQLWRRTCPCHSSGQPVIHRDHHVRLIAAIYKDLGIAKKLQLFSRLFRAAGKPFTMGFRHVGKHADSWPDDPRQPLHLPTAAYTRFEDGQLMGSIQLPDTERDAYLRIIALGASDHLILV